MCHIGCKPRDAANNVDDNWVGRTQWYYNMEGYDCRAV